MSNDDIKKLILMVRTMPEGHKILRNLLADYLAIREDKQKLVKANLTLLEDIKQYEFLMQEFTTKEIVVN